MGCDIHSAVEVLRDGSWQEVKERIFPMSIKWCGHTHTTEPFDWRSYGMFAFLANVRNYSFVPALSDPRGFPDDVAAFPDHEDSDRHSSSWLSLRELIDFDYAQTFEDRRCSIAGNGAADSGLGNGKIVTYREFLGDLFFRDIEIMRGLGDPEKVRVVFCFDN